MITILLSFLLLTSNISDTANFHYKGERIDFLFYNTADLSKCKIDKIIEIIKISDRFIVDNHKDRSIYFFIGYSCSKNTVTRMIRAYDTTGVRGGNRIPWDINISIRGNQFCLEEVIKILDFSVVNWGYIRANQRFMPGHLYESSLEKVMTLPPEEVDKILAMPLSDKSRKYARRKLCIQAK